MKRILALVAVSSFTLGAAACGKKSGVGGGTALDAPPGLEAAQVKTVGGSTELPKVLADYAATRAKLIAAIEKSGRLRGAKIDDDDIASLLSSPAGWEAAGLDPKGEITVVMDRRVGMSDDDVVVPLPIVLVKVSDRDKLLAAVTKADDKVKVGPKAGAIEPVMRGDRTVGFIGAHGDRLAIVPRFDGDADKVRAGFEAFLAGSGSSLADADAFKHAMDDGPAGAGLYYWIGDTAQLDPVGRMFGLRRRERERMADLLSMQLTAVGMRLGQDGLSFRIVPKDVMRDAFKAVYRGNDSPRDIGRVIPAKGWAAGRLSVDLKGGVTAALSALGQSDGMVQAALGRLGLSWDEITDALSGEIGFGVDVASAMAAYTGRGGGLPNSINVIGVRDGDKADALVDKLTKLAVDAMGMERSDITVGGKKAIRLGGRRDATVVVARHDDLVLLTMSEAAMAEAIARADGDNLSKTSAGEVLRERLAFAGVVDLGPVLAWLDGNAERMDRDGMGVVLSLATSSEAFRKDPTLTLRMGFDDRALFATIKDTGLTYGLALTGVVSMLVSQGVKRPEHFEGATPVVEGDLPATCTKFLAGYERCIEEMPEDSRAPARDAVKAMREAWQRAPRDGMESACQQAFSAMKQAAESMCPKVVWE